MNSGGSYALDPVTGKLKAVETPTREPTTAERRAARDAAAQEAFGLEATPAIGDQPSGPVINNQSSVIGHQSSAAGRRPAKIPAKAEDQT